MRPSATLIGVIAALTAIVVAPFFSVPEYSSARNAISELGAQGSPNAWIMRAGFVAYGLGVLVDAARRLRVTPLVGVVFVVFGLAMAMSAVFSHRPVDQTLSYDVREDELHSLFATVVGFAFTFGAVAQSFIERSLWRRLACYVAAVAAIGLPLAMLGFAEIAGVLQRLMFAISFAWLVEFLPANAVSESRSAEPSSPPA